ncbi:MAG: class I SAM-dependent methyltransferase [Propylenella sp.]
MDAHYEIAELVELYDVACGWSPDRDFYLALAGAAPIAVLDLGCGTGLLCDAYAVRNHEVTGVDPSPAMLAVAQRKPNASVITWVQASAQDHRSDQKFDLEIMTGHAFQTLLDDADILRAFETMRAHLNPGGLIVFESRNPGFDWRSVWDRDKMLEHSGLRIVERSRLLELEDGRLTFELTYLFPEKTLVSRSVLNFPTRAKVLALLSESGLSVEAVLGDWDGTPFDEGASREMIFLARAA